MACAATFALFMLFVPESTRIEPRRPELIYITTLDESRSEAEIITSNCANQRLQNALRARLEERAELRREIYRQLGEATFVDVEEMEAQAEEQRAASAEPEGPTDEELALSLEEYCSRAEG